jgi:fumarate reductase subunit C
MQKKVLPNVKMYKRRMNIFWWSKRWIHIKLIARELTSVCVAVYVIVLLYYVRAAMQGQEAFESFTAILQSPVIVLAHMVLLGGLVFHSITWFNLAPKAMVIKIGEKNIPGVVIALMNYGGWVVVSIAIAWLMLK